MLHPAAPAVVVVEERRGEGEGAGGGGALEYIRTLHMKVTSFQPGEIRGASAER